MESGNLAYRNNNFSTTRQYFENCFLNFEKYGGSSKYPEFLSAYAHCLLESADISRAKTIFKQVIFENPKNYFALKNLGFIAFQFDKNYTQAIHYYNLSIQANSPDYFQSYSNLGTIHLVINQTNKAIEYYELALKYGSSQMVLTHLFLLWKTKGDQESSEYYQAQIK